MLATFALLTIAAVFSIVVVTVRYNNDVRELDARVDSALKEADIKSIDDFEPIVRQLGSEWAESLNRTFTRVLTIVGAWFVLSLLISIAKSAARTAKMAEQRERRAQAERGEPDEPSAS